MNAESLGTRLASAIHTAMDLEGPGVEVFTLKFPGGRKAFIVAVRDEHEPLLRKAVEDLISFNMSERERKRQESFETHTKGN